MCASFCSPPVAEHGLGAHPKKKKESHGFPSCALVENCSRTLIIYPCFGLSCSDLRVSHNWSSSSQDTQSQVMVYICQVYCTLNRIKNTTMPVRILSVPKLNCLHQRKKKEKEKTLLDRLGRLFMVSSVLAFHVLHLGIIAP